MSAITLPRAVVEQALEALKSVKDHRPNDETNNAITALRAAPPQQAEPAQEPEGLAWRYTARIGYVVRPYTAAPPPPQRLPLTEEEIDKIFKHLCNTVGASCKTMARAVERAHGIGETQ